MIKLLLKILGVAFSLLLVPIVFMIAYKNNMKIYNIFFLTLSLACIVVCIVIGITVKLEESSLKNKLDRLNYTAYTRKDLWLKSAIIWQVVHYWMIASSFFATCIVIYISVDNGNTIWTVTYSSISLFFSVMHHVVSPLSISRGYRKAFRELDKVFGETYTGDVDNMVLDAINKGELLIEEYSYCRK